ncbi:MAG: type III-A CRISPR-associated RAMP protein Csm5 [Selenomonadaceae bacterium]|nr:type III-A CRISPR-associated RAMP protein Csm5 [Selenomonadaceae bacterium]
MKDYLQEYKVKLTALSPVFVGSGQEFSKKEYVFLPQKKIGVLDMDKLYSLASHKAKRRQFEELMLDPRGNLGYWLDSQRLYEAATKDCIAYTLDTKGVEFQKGKTINVKSCIKDAYGKPYVPGSTLKGMFRSILATAEILQNANLKGYAHETLARGMANERSGKNYLQRTTEGIEAKLFRTLNLDTKHPTDAVNDVLSGLIVSDSAPLDVSNLVPAQQIEYHKDGEEKSLPILRESLRPKTEINFTITVDEKKYPLTKEKLLKAITAFDETYSDNFISAFRGIDRLHPPQVFVGGGTGFVSKTLVYPIQGKNDGVDTTMKIFANTLSRKIQETHKHYKDKADGISPRILKCTHYGGRTVLMGLCKIEIE